jgi:hypothetical protein
MMTVEVVNMRTCNPPWGQPGDIRIDRATKWGNPFHIDDHNTRESVIGRYEVYFVRISGLDISEIATAKRLGCWCKPKACHGDVLKKLIGRYNESKQKRLI